MIEPDSAEERAVHLEDVTLPDIVGLVLCAVLFVGLVTVALMSKVGLLKMPRNNVETTLASMEGTK